MMKRTNWKVGIAAVATLMLGVAGCVSSQKTAEKSAEMTAQPVQLAADMPIVPPVKPPMPKPTEVPSVPPVRPPTPAQPGNPPANLDDEQAKLLKENAALQDAIKKAREVGVNKGHIHHTVIVWLKKPGDAAARKAIIEAADTLRSIPGVVDVSAGEVVPSERKVVDSTYDVGICVIFKDEKSLRAYDQHPTHLKAVNDVLKPNVEKFVVYDFVER